MKASRTVFVRNVMGLHARPSSTIARLLQHAKSEVTLACGGQTANARSVVEILMLAARKDAEVEITAEGDDAEEVLDRLATAFEAGLDVHI